MKSSSPETGDLKGKGRRRQSQKIDADSARPYLAKARNAVYKEPPVDKGPHGNISGYFIVHPLLNHDV